MKNRKRCSKESGQALLLVLLVLAIFLLGSLAFAVDMGFLWWHRQTAQTSADAACVAGAMDLLVYNQSPNPSILYPWVSTTGGSFDCKGQADPNVKANPGPCQYAARNGYYSEGTVPGNSVYVSFPKTLTGVATPPTAAVVPFMRVDVLDHAQTFFWGLLSGETHADVRAFATCGAVQVNAPVPILVLAPTGAGTLNMNGGGGSGNNIKIIGGPPQSVQVDSSDPAAACVYCLGGSASATVDLSQAGPNNNGADFGIWGDGSNQSFVTCGTGDPQCWKPGTTPIADPFATVTIPNKTSLVQNPAPVTGVSGNGCGPIVAGGTCTQYKPGYYQNGISLKKVGAIFDPGIYYIDDQDGKDTGLSVDDLSCVRPSTVAGDGSFGTVFIFVNGAPLSVGSNSGAKCVTTFSTGSGGASGNGVFCPTLPPTLPLNLPASVTGNVFLAPCVSVGLNQYGGDKIFGDNTQRGMLFFHGDHVPIAKSVSQPTLAGGGSYAAGGVIYFHSTDYTDQFTLKGGSGTGSFAFGDIVVDNLQIGGGGGISMYLSPALLSAGVMKATLLQ
jgi:hypothetical protein